MRPPCAGINYQFDLEWEVGQGPGSGGQQEPEPEPPRAFVYHRLMVTRDRTKAYSVLSHVAGTRSVGTGSGCGESGVPGTCAAQDPEEAGRAPRAVVRKQGGTWHDADGLDGAPASTGVHERFALASLPSPEGKVVSLERHAVCSISGTDCSATPAALPVVGEVVDRAWVVPPGPTDSAGKVRILCYNIWNINGHDDGAYTARLHKLAEQIRSTDADIVALQEASAHYLACRRRVPSRQTCLLG